MDIQNLLFLKKKYISILSYLTEIMNTYDELYSRVNGETLFKQYTKYKSEITELNFLINNINYTLCEICHHDYARDEIDINPDRSLQIEYCKICEYSKEFGFS